MVDKIGLGYKDVSLISRQISTIPSRDQIQIHVQLFPGVSLTTPVISSPMKDVTNASVAKELRKLGGIGILHRFCSIDEHVEEYHKVDYTCICAVGLDQNDRLSALYTAGCKYFCLDTANGANIRVKEFINSTRTSYPDIYWIVGNVVSKEGFDFCASIDGVTAVRVGVSGGGACSTYKSTGIFHAPISLINECKIDSNHFINSNPDVLLIADGGIEEPLDLAKSLIFGADICMCGSLIASTMDSPATIIHQDGRMYKVLHGSASFEIQRLHRENVKYIEGKSILLEYNSESLEDLIERFMWGLRSSMSYYNARTLEEYRANLDYTINL
jgi:IMP dehydrogenase